MEKLLNYIKNGRGVGIKWLLLFSLIITIFLTINLKLVGDETFVPTAQKIADEFLPIKIENGIITDPVDTIKTYTILVGDENNNPQQIDIIMDTALDTLDMSKIKNGIFITKNALYTIANNQIEIYKFEDSIYLPKDDYTEFFSSILNWSIAFLFVFGFIGLFIFYLLATLFYAGCSYAVSLLLKKKFEFNLRMRLSMFSFIVTYTVFIFLSLFLSFFVLKKHKIVWVVKMNLSELQRKDVINMENAKRLGRIIDAEINEKGTIEFFVVMDHKFWKFWKSNGEFNITINQIKKIGTDVILVDQII